MYTLFEDSIEYYFEKISHAIYVETDLFGSIKNCNEGFNKLIEKKKKPINHYLTEFLVVNIDTHSQLILDNDMKPIEFYYLYNDKVKQMLKGVVIARGDSLLYIGERVHLDDFKILEQMGELNLELANLTREISKKNRDLGDKNDRITDLMLKDPLTDLNNRRFLYQEFEHFKKEYETEHIKDLLLVMIDIDYFKKINDQYGHDIGDLVLVEFSKIIKNHTRDDDIKVRFGGDEFVIIFKNVSVEVALERLKAIQNGLLTHAIDAVHDSIGTSFGLVRYQRNETFQDFIKRGDLALYKAKEKGRGCIQRDV